MRKLAVLAVIGFLVAGCSSTPAEEAATDEVEAQSTSEPATVAQSEEVEPLVAETKEEESVEPGTAEEAFLAEVRDGMESGGTVIPDATDEQLLKAGWDACEQLGADDVINNDVRVVEGEEPDVLGYYTDSLRIAVAAETYICP